MGKDVLWLECDCKCGVEKRTDLDSLLSGWFSERGQAGFCIGSGNMDQARQDYDQALAIDPANRAAIERRRELERKHPAQE